MRALCFSLAVVVFSLPLPAQEPVRVQGVAPLSKVLKAMVAPLSEKGIEIKVLEDCGNAQAITALGEGVIDLALVSRTLTAEERANYPDRHFEETQVGTQAVGLLVSRAIWESGIRSLPRKTIAGLYGGKIERWKDVGGENRAVKIFDSVQGRGIWEMFAAWVYGDVHKAPGVPWEVMEKGSDIRDAIQFNSGGAGIASLTWADGRDVFPVALIDDAGTVLDPTPAAIAAGKYPLARRMYVVVNDKPTGHRRKTIEFLVSEAGQKIVAANELLPVTPPTP